GGDPINNPKLKDFVEIPTYFRYLHEWGQNFCKERKKRLKQIKVDCRGENGVHKTCSGDGEDCNDNLPEDPSIFPSLNCPSCGKSCGFYKKWINIKKDEFLKQKKEYTGQKDKCEKGSEGAKEFCKTLKTCTDAADFLEKLGPCKTNNNVEEDNGEDKLDFTNPEKTFVPATNCDPCSEFKVKCKNGVCTGGVTKGNCNGGTITEKDIEKMNDLNGNIDMLVSDDNPNGNKFDGLQACRGAGIFTGIKENKWKCGKVCGYNVCKPENSNGENVSGKPNGENPIITITALVKRWLEYFFDDYNKIKQKISHCTKNGEGFTCINGCVDQWINQKRTEWENIKKRFLEQYKKPDNYNVRSVLEELIPQIPVANVKNDVIKLSKFGNSCGCSAIASAQKNVGYEDAIECMITKLQKKIEECQSKHSDSPEKPCVDSPSPIETPPEESLEEEEENEKTNKQPGF
ncbi:hypothetical protein PFTANZ_06511, partial [Plasmodium falciparum Tanzania (2000708)]